MLEDVQFVSQHVFAFSPALNTGSCSWNARRDSRLDCAKMAVGRTTPSPKVSRQRGMKSIPCACKSQDNIFCYYGLTPDSNSFRFSKIRRRLSAAFVPLTISSSSMASPSYGVPVISRNLLMSSLTSWFGTAYC